MRRKLAALTGGLMLLTSVGAAQVSAPHGIVMGTDVKWGDPPPSLQKGAKFAVLSGDPSTVGPFVVRLMLPSGYRVPPHWHPADEYLTVLAGTFALGTGEVFDRGALKDLPAGGYASMPAEARHYALAKTAVTLQVHGWGPFVFNYVNPAEDPRGPAVQ